MEVWCGDGVLGLRSASGKPSLSLVGSTAGAREIPAKAVKMWLVSGRGGRGEEG